jgi:hypothetical protein
VPPRLHSSYAVPCLAAPTTSRGYRLGLAVDSNHLWPSSLGVLTAARFPKKNLFQISTIVQELQLEIKSTPKHCRACLKPFPPLYKDPPMPFCSVHLAAVPSSRSSYRPLLCCLPHRLITRRCCPMVFCHRPMGSQSRSLTRDAAPMLSFNQSTPLSPARCGPSPPPKVSKTVVSRRCDAVGRSRVQIGAP